jgi:hypothetical protein
MVYTTPRPDDDAQLAAWRRRQAEDAVRSINIRLPLDLARRLRAEAAARGVPAGRYVGDLLRVTLGDLPGGQPPAPTPPSIAAGSMTLPQTPPVPDDPGHVRLRDLRIIQLHTGRDGEPRQLDTAERPPCSASCADLAWLKDRDRQVS